MVESLTSYIMRLAEAHDVNVYHLAARVILPAIGVHDKWWAGFQTANGFGRMSRRLVTGLEHLTLRRDLVWLTTLPWGTVLSARGLLRSGRAWCPACLEEQRLKGQSVHEPLLWAFDVVTMCPRHNRMLCLQCPKCGRRQLSLRLNSQPGRCYRCRQWFGDLPPATAALEFIDESHDEKRQRWRSKTLGDALAAVTGGRSRPQPGKFQSILGVFCNRFRECQDPRESLSALSRAFGLPYHALHRRHLSRVVSLRTALDVGYALGISATDLLNDASCTQDLNIPTTSAVRSLCEESGLRLGSLSQHHQALRLRHAMESALADPSMPCPSLTKIAASYGYSRVGVSRKYPKLTRALVKRHRDQQYRAYERKVQHIRTSVPEAVRALTASGVYPSRNRVAGKLGYPHTDKTVARYWRETLKQLGVKSRQ